MSATCFLAAPTSSFSSSQRERSTLERAYPGVTFILVSADAQIPQLRGAGMAAAGALLLGGCDEPATSPQTEAGQLSGFTYIPLDPLPVSEERGRGCFTDDRGENELRPVLPSLPDNAVRLMEAASEVDMPDANA